MNPLPLDQIRFGWRSHLSALWWLGILYRWPNRFRKLAEVEYWTSILTLLIHALPWMLAVVVVVRLVGNNFYSMQASLADLKFTAGRIVAGIGFGVVTGTLLRLLFGIRRLIHRSGIHFLIIPAVSFGIAFGIFSINDFSIATIIVFGLVLGINSGIMYAITRESNVSFEIVLAITILLSTPLLVGTVVWSWLAAGSFPYAKIFTQVFNPFIISFILGITRVYYYPVHIIFIWPKEKGRWYRYHPIAWDDMCSFPLYRLDRLLVAVAEIDSLFGEKEINRLIDEYPSQRIAALRAKAVLIARQCGRESNLLNLPSLVTIYQEKANVSFSPKPVQSEK